MGPRLVTFSAALLACFATASIPFTAAQCVTSTFTTSPIDYAVNMNELNGDPAAPNFLFQGNCILEVKQQANGGLLAVGSATPTANRITNAVPGPITNSMIWTYNNAPIAILCNAAGTCGSMHYKSGPPNLYVNDWPSAISPQSTVLTNVYNAASQTYTIYQLDQSLVYIWVGQKYFYLGQTFWADAGVAVVKAFLDINGQSMQVFGADASGKAVIGVLAYPSAANSNTFTWIKAPAPAATLLAIGSTPAPPAATTPAPAATTPAPAATTPAPAVTTPAPATSAPVINGPVSGPVLGVNTGASLNLVPAGQVDPSLRSTSNTDAQKLIVDLHNQVRKSQGAANMLKIQWDPVAAVGAQAWADGCVFQHGPSVRNGSVFSGCGQNIASGQNSWYDVVQAWAPNEQAQFTYGLSPCPDTYYQKIGHYTQVAWATTWSVGCGFTACGNSVGNFYVCNYCPAGNVGTGVCTPYLPGTLANGGVCGSCGGVNSPTCSDGLCTNTCNYSNKYSNCDVASGTYGALFPTTAGCVNKNDAFVQACAATCQCRANGLIY